MGKIRLILLICFGFGLILVFGLGKPYSSYSTSELKDALTLLNQMGSSTRVTIMKDGVIKTLTLNPSIYLTYNKIVYESPSGTFKDRDKGRLTVLGFTPLKWQNNSGVPGEYRYLGVDISGNLINNDEFPKDVASGVPLTNKLWDRYDKNVEVWYNMTKNDPAIIQYILHNKVIDDGMQTDLSLMDILKRRTTDENEALAYIQLQSLPTFYSDGVVKLTRNGGAYYGS